MTILKKNVDESILHSTIETKHKNIRKKLQIIIEDENQIENKTKSCENKSSGLQ